MKRVKWRNVMKLLVMLIAASVVIYDMYKLTIYSFITDKLGSWTWYGFTTFIMCFAIASVLYFDVFESTKKVD